MRLPMVDCRSLIEFCRAFEHHKNNMKQPLHPSSVSYACARRLPNRNNQKTQLCGNHHCCSPYPLVDLVILLSVSASVGYLAFPYVKFAFDEILNAVPIICTLMVDEISNAPFAYFFGLGFAVIGLLVVLIVYEIVDMRSRKCGNPNCRGLRKAIEFDIQLESEECVKCLPKIPYGNGVKPLELGEDHKELEAELKRMAPTNGRTVLIFRARCGCPAGRLEVWGQKKVRRIKK